MYLILTCPAAEAEAAAARATKIAGDNAEAKIWAKAARKWATRARNCVLSGDRFQALTAEEMAKGAERAALDCVQRRP